MIKRTLPGIGGVLEELALGGEDDEGDLGVAEDRDLVGLLEQARPPLGEGDLPVDLVLYPLQLKPAPPHPISLQFTTPNTHQELPRIKRRGARDRSVWSLLRVL